MTIGEHLDELRGCLLRSLLALVAACLPCIWLAQTLLKLIAHPLVVALERHGQPSTFLALGPTDPLMNYIKIVLVSGIVIAAPYIILQIWSFVAAGLYEHETRMIRRPVPLSAGLFFLGVVFMYLFVLPLSLNFLIGFSSWFPRPDSAPTELEQLLLGPSPTPAESQPAHHDMLQAPLLLADPAEAPPGGLWVNLSERKLKVRLGDYTYVSDLVREDRRTMMTTHFPLSEYLSFVIMLTIAFGAAFQMPLAVVFLARTGIVPVTTFRQYRKVVILVIVIIAGFIAPPDLLSHLLLSGPMILLFELGLLLATAKKPARASSQK